MLWQVSVVCHSFQAAAQGLLASSENLHLNISPDVAMLEPLCMDEEGHLLLRLDSKLLCRWAGGVQGLSFDAASYTIPGLAAFLQAASSLQRVQVECYSVLEAAQAEYVLLGCSRASHVTVRGFSMPGGFPESLAELYVEFSLDEGRLAPWDPSVASALLYKLARHTGLRSIRLDFDAWDCPNIQLDCRVPCLPPLEVWLSFGLHAHARLDLSWLWQQPCSLLALRVYICTDSPARHEQLMQQLRQLPVTRLSVVFDPSHRTPPHIVSLWREFLPNGAAHVHAWVPADARAAAACKGIACVIYVARRLSPIHAGQPPDDGAHGVCLGGWHANARVRG